MRVGVSGVEIVPLGISFSPQHTISIRLFHSTNPTLAASCGGLRGTAHQPNPRSFIMRRAQWILSLLLGFGATIGLNGTATGTGIYDTPCTITYRYAAGNQRIYVFATGF